MSTETIADPAQTATPPVMRRRPLPAQEVQGMPQTTLKNGWGTAATTAQPATAPTAPAATDQSVAAASPPAATEAAQAATEQAAPAPQAANEQATPAAATEQAAPAQDATAQAAAAQVDGSTPAPAPTENREQLHRRVQSRLTELEEARDQLAGHDGNKARARAIETELQVARDAMSGGWEHVGPIEAAHLSQWLTNTGNLIVTKPAE